LVHVWVALCALPGSAAEGWDDLMPKRRDADLTRMIGARIRTLRIERGFTQEELAERVGLQPGSLSRVETGAMGPSFVTLGELSRIFGVPMSLILEGVTTQPDLGLSEEELKLVHFFREVPSEYRSHLTELVKVAARLPTR
jgi:transcriptional regulator with XRE-family HTH domain